MKTKYIQQNNAEDGWIIFQNFINKQKLILKSNSQQ